MEERIIRSIGEHWVVYLFPSFLFGFSLVLGYGLFHLGWAVSHEDREIAMMLWMLSSLTWVVIVHLMGVFLMAKNLSMLILTSKRIILLNFLPYMRHDVDILPLAELHEVEKKKHGLIENLLNYGTIEINIGSIPKPLVFKKVPRPTDLANMLGELYRMNHPERTNQNTNDS